MRNDVAHANNSNAADTSRPLPLCIKLRTNCKIRLCDIVGWLNGMNSRELLRVIGSILRSVHANYNNSIPMKCRIRQGGARRARQNAKIESAMHDAAVIRDLFVGNEACSQPFYLVDGMVKTSCRE